MRFPIVVHKDETSGYGVSVPDLPGCFSSGDSLDGAIESAHEAIACHLEGCSWTERQFPNGRHSKLTGPPRRTKAESGRSARSDISKLSSKAKRANITMPARVLTIVDEAAAREGDTRSGLLARAALSYVERHAIHI